MIASGSGGSQCVEVIEAGGLKKMLTDIGFGQSGPTLDYARGTLYFCGGSTTACYNGVYQSEERGKY